MGYMGFGMRKEVYTRKPRKPFVKLKELYLDELNKTKDNSDKDSKFSKGQVEEAKLRIRKKLRKKRQKNIFIYVFVFLILILIIWYFFK